MVNQVRLDPTLLLIVLTSALLSADVVADTDGQPLFHIDRSQNNKIVKYDAQLEPDGTLNRKKPVVAYWYRPDDAEEPTRKLSWVQRRFAYGFKAKLDEASQTVTMDMVAELGRPIVVIREDDDYQATIRIDGSNCYIDQIYIASTGRGMNTKVDYIDLKGRDVQTGEVRQERITPR